MATPASPTIRRLVVALAAILAVGACTPERDEIARTPDATIAQLPVASASASAGATGSPSVSPDERGARDDEGATAGGTDPAPSAAPSAAATPSAATTPIARPSPTASRDVAAAREPFAMNLAARSDFVAQYTFEWCVGASLQMALNMATDQTRTSRADQGRLWAMARDRSASPFGGANPRGWTAALNDLGVGPYRLVSLPSFDEALVTAAEALRATRRPVGLVMWRGRHAWVMSGFESKGDPRHVDDPRITRVRVHDPLYPHGSAVWGRSPKPNSLISPAALARQFVKRENRRVDLGVPDGWLLVLPVADA
jgi:hypothetical protein